MKRSSWQTLAVRVPTECLDTESTPGLLSAGADAKALLVLAHGAGAGMEHPHLERLSGLLAQERVATLRYQFPYMAAGRRRPDRPASLHATVRRVVGYALTNYPDLALFAGGRSMGGRMTTQAQAKLPLLGVRGLVLFAFPLHPPKRIGTERAEHLGEIAEPMLFLQGTRDSLADLVHMRRVSSDLGKPATLHVVEEADHSFKILKRSGRTTDEVEAELARTTSEWIDAVGASRGK